MNSQLEPAASREQIRAALQAQRQQIADRLRPVPPAQQPFPRSLVMRILMRRPDLAAGWMGALLRSRRGSSAVLLLALALGLKMAITAPRRTQLSNTPEHP